MKQNDAMNKISQQREYYNQIAHQFDDKHNRENSNHFYKVEQIEAAFEKYLPASPDGWNLMEIGAGSGIHAHHVSTNLSGKINSFVLADLSAEMLEVAKTRMTGLLGIHYLVSPAENIAWSEPLDGIYISGSMHHFLDYEAAIQGAKKLLKKKGILVICEPNVWNPVNLYKAIKDYSLESGQFSVTRPAVNRTLLANGFKVLSNRVLHYRGASAFAQKFYPPERVESFKLMDLLAVMYLIVAQVDD